MAGRASATADARLSLPSRLASHHLAILSETRGLVTLAKFAALDYLGIIEF